MPLYEFTCAKCGHAFEELLTARELEAGPPKCPACRSKKVKRGFSSFATGGAPAGGFPPSGGGGCGPGGFT
jgi:putative FmdB family regulatory protein